MDTSIIHQVCGHQMSIFNASFAHMLWLANKKGNYPEFCLSYTDETWYIGTQW